MEALPGLRPTEEPSDEINGNLRQLGENELADKIRGAIGAEPFAEVSVYAPPHRSRGDGMEVAYMPLTLDDFERLRALPEEELTRIGLRRWDESGLMLFPYEWFGLIPKGLPIVDIFGNASEFDPAKDDDEARYGVLSFGFIPAPSLPEQGGDDAD